MTSYDLRVMKLDVMSREVNLLVRMFSAAGVEVQEVNVLGMSGAESLAVFNGKDLFIKLWVRSKRPEDKGDDRNVLDNEEKVN